MSTVRSVFHTSNNRPVIAGWVSSVLSIGALFVYANMLWTYAHIQLSVLDEGLYLYKGWLFSNGIYTPFQDYGVWTNQMPLAFLIPGWMQQLFGPGLRTGRMLAVVLGLLTALALWLTARRLGGQWVAAGCLAALALNPAAARMVSMAASQGLVACLLVWSFFFSLGADRKNWQLFFGGLLAGVVVMVRINMLPLLPLLALYVYWARGLRPALYWLGGSLLSFGGTHLAYWPNILKLWAKWLPLPFIKAWAPPANTPTWKPDNPLQFRMASFFLAFRYHFAALAGALAAWVFWPRFEKNNRLDAEKHKIAVFLSVLLLVLFLLHAWAALGNEYCVFCFPTYSAFYTGAGLLLVAITLPAWNLKPAVWRAWLGSLAFLTLLAGMAYSAEDAAGQMLGPLFYKRLLALPVPGLRGALLWQVFANKFGLEYKPVYDSFHTWLPVGIALGLGLLLVAGTQLGTRLFRKSSSRPSTPTWSLGILVIFLLGSTFSPAPVLAGDYTTYDCGADMITVYETTGNQLMHAIPAGSRIFWAGYSPVTLDYLPDVNIYPAQLHGAYSFRISPDDDALLKYGWWNEHLAQKWLAEADYVLAGPKNLDKRDWLYGKLDGFELMTSTTIPARAGLEISAQCQENTAILLYRRK